jgi:hypothetical protein
MTYLNKDILSIIPLADNNQNIEGHYTLVGKEYKKQEKFPLAPSQHKFRWTYALKTRDVARELRAFFRSNYGKYGSFWLPSFKKDIEFVSYKPTNPNAFVAKRAARAEGTYEQNRHICIPDLGFMAKIVFIENLNKDKEIITLNKPAPAGLVSASGKEWNRIFKVDFYDLFWPFLNAILYPEFEADTFMNLFFVRLNSDEFTLSKKENDYWMQSTLEFLELQRETP